MPISSFSDQRNLRIGNPNLDPEFTHSYELGYLYEWAKGSILSSIYMRNSDGVIQRVASSDSIGTSVTFENIGTRDNYGLELNLENDWTRKFNTNVNLNLFRAISQGNRAVGNLYADAFSWTGRFTAKYKIISNLQAQANFNYNAPQDIPQGRVRAIWWLDFAVSYDMLENQLTWTLSGQDVFSTRMRRITLEDQDFFFNQDFQWRRGQITLTASYRFD